MAGMNYLREKYQSIVARAEEIQVRMVGAEGVSAEDTVSFDTAVAEAEAVATQITEMEQREARLAALRERTDRIGSAPKLAHEDSKNTRGGKHEYSITRAVSAQMRGVNPDGLEGEVHSDLIRFRPNTRGVLIPMSTEVSYTKRSLSPANAAGAISTAVRGPIIDALMSRLVLAQAGAQVIVSDGLFKLPLATSGATFWGTSVPTGADRNIGQLAFTAHTLGGLTKIDRQTLTTANLDTVTYVWDQLLKDISVGYQAGCFHGAGSDDPKGLFAYASGDGVSTFPQGTDGGVLSYQDVVSMAGAVEQANGGDVVFLTNPTVISKLEATPRESGYPVYVADTASKSIAGRPYYSTSSIKKNLSKGSSGNTLSAIAAVDPSVLVMAMFSAIDVFANPYSNDGGTTLSAFLDCDFGITRPAAVAISTDVSTA